ncbi:MAG: hypothetical protein ACRYFZ_01685 [Janthinobacterium lividum]
MSLQTFRTSPAAPDFDEVTDTNYEHVVDPTYDEAADPDYDQQADPDYDEASRPRLRRGQPARVCRRLHGARV